MEKFDYDNQNVFVPQKLRKLAELKASHPNATLLAGGTDLGLLFSKERNTLTSIICTSNVLELNEIIETEEYIEVGASVSYTNLLPHIERLYPSFATLITRIGSRQIRNIGTLGGNIGTASPIGDTLPCLIALDATLILFSNDGTRELPLEEFFIGYRKTNLKSGEFIKSIKVPDACCRTGKSSSRTCS